MLNRNNCTAIALSALLLGACSKDKVVDLITGPTVTKQWDLTLSPRNENPAPASRTETGTATLKLMSDNSLQYAISVAGLAAGDALTNAHIHTGDPVTNGPVILGFSPTFSNNTASGTISNVRQSFVDSLTNGSAELYVNVHSTQAPGGLLRAQLNHASDLSLDIPLMGSNEVPAVSTTATGTALIRITSDKKLYAKISVTGLEAGDALTAAHIHTAATGVNGPVLVGIYSSAASFGTPVTITLTDAQYNSIKNDAVYVNAHSTAHPAGIIRGQIR